MRINVKMFNKVVQKKKKILLIPITFDWAVNKNAISKTLIMWHTQKREESITDVLNYSIPCIMTRPKLNTNWCAVADADTIRNNDTFMVSLVTVNVAIKYAHYCRVYAIKTGLVSMPFTIHIIIYIICESCEQKMSGECKWVLTAKCK